MTVRCPSFMKVKARPPERTLEEGRRRTRNDLIARGMDIDDAVRWCAAWEAEADRLGRQRDTHFWNHATRWIDHHLAKDWRCRPRTR